MGFFARRNEISKLSFPGLKGRAPAAVRNNNQNKSETSGICYTFPNFALTHPRGVPVALLYCQTRRLDDSEKMSAAGLEPTPLSRLRPERSALDRSARLTC